MSGVTEQTQHRIDDIVRSFKSSSAIESKILLSSLRPPEVANVLESFRPKVRQVIWDLLDEEIRNQTLQHLNEDVRGSFLQDMNTAQLVAVADDLDTELNTLREICHYLERQAVLIAAPDELFFDRDAVLSLIDAVLKRFQLDAEMDTQTLKTLIGTSRRTAMPLMALLDDLQITRRDGSIRRLLNKTPRW